MTAWELGSMRSGSKHPQIWSASWRGLILWAAAIGPTFLESRPVFPTSPSEPEPAVNGDNLHHQKEFSLSLSLSCFDVPLSVAIYTAATCCLESASLPCCTDPNCTQAHKHGPGPRRCPPYRQEPKVPPVEMSLFPLDCHTMSATLWSQLKARRTQAFVHSTHSTAKALTLTRSY